MNAHRAFVGTSLLASAILLGTLGVTNAESQPGTATPAKKGKSCTSSSPCLTENNTGAGAALLGESTSGNALEGEATTGTGVLGSSTGSAAAVYGTNSGSGSGVYAYSVTGAGVTAQSHAGYAVSGYSAEDNGIFGQSGAPYAVGVLGYSGAVGGYATAGQSDSSSTLALAAFGGSSGSGALDVFDAFDSQGNVILYVDDEGDLRVSGELYTSGSCRNGCTDTRHVVSYGAQSSSPTIDDVGEATLRDGRAEVAIDADFANVIDATRPYVVLLTPEGDAALYVTNRTPRGFEVAQVGGGHASVPFAYRVVAHPYGRRQGRLPFVTTAKVRPPKPPAR